MINELLWLILLLVNFAAILLAYRVWGRLGLFIWIPVAVMVANIQVTKTIELFGITATLGNIVYASSFLVTDILSENYGKKEAGRAVIIGFFTLIMFTLLMNLALFFEPSMEDFAHESLFTIFGFLPRIMLASLVAYGVSQSHDIWAFHLWKKKWPETKHLWLRNNLSTMVSQLLDSVIFSLIAFYGVFSTGVLLEIMLTTYVLKWIVAALDTPFVYLGKYMFKHYDHLSVGTSVF
jgi:queuosine precursor transporter